MAKFTGQAATRNTFSGTAGADLFQWATAYLNRLDSAAGGGGLDVLQLTTRGVLANTALAGVSGIERFVLAQAGNGITLLDANFADVAGTKIVVKGGAGNDTIDGSKLTGSNRIDVTAGAGLDAFSGGAGNDTFRFSAAGLAGDSVRGGAGNDTLLLSSAGTITAEALVHVTGVEKILLANGSNSITLTNANFFDQPIANRVITIIGTRGNDTIDASQVTNRPNRIHVTAGAGLDKLIGGVSYDEFRFTAANLTKGDTVQGGGGYDTLILATAGILADDALAGVNGIEYIDLAKGVNDITLSDANFVAAGELTVTGSEGRSRIDASALTGRNKIAYIGGSGVDTVLGGGGNDRFEFSGPNKFRRGTVIDGGGDAGGSGDRIFFYRSMDFLGDTITGIEFLYGDGTVTANISGENAARLKGFDSFPDGLTQTYNVQLSAGSVTDLSHLMLIRADAGDAINVVSNGGNTAVTLSNSIARFTGSADADTVGFAPGGSYKAGAVIDGGGGNDRIAYADASAGLLDGGTGFDVLVLSGAATVDLGNATNQFVTGKTTVRNFEGVVASASSAAVTLTGNDAFNRLIGGSGADTITAGTGGATIGGGLGADVLKGGSGNDRFVWSDKLEGGDTITGFVPLLDKLGFSGQTFTFSGANFDVLTDASGASSINLDTTDLLRIAPKLNTAADVRAYLDDNTTSTSHGLFVVATSDAGSNVLYYTSNAAKNGADSAVFQIADLSAGGTAPDLSNFLFF